MESIVLQDAAQLRSPAEKTRRDNPWRQRIKRAMIRCVPRDRFLVRGPRGSDAVCLTFDDGPHPLHTPRLLDVLKAEGVAATFFLIGMNVERHPEIVRRIVDEGHVIAHHTYSHQRPASLSAARLAAEIRRTDDLFRRITGRPSRLFRPPWGKLSAAKFVRLWAAGQGIVLWTKDPRDCERRDVGEVRAWFAAHPLGPGDILLMHDDQPFAADVIADVIADLRGRGLRFTTPLAWM